MVFFLHSTYTHACWPRCALVVHCAAMHSSCGHAYTETTPVLMILWFFHYLINHVISYASWNVKYYFSSSFALKKKMIFTRCSLRVRVVESSSQRWFTKCPYKLGYWPHAKIFFLTASANYEMPREISQKWWILK